KWRDGRDDAQRLAYQRLIHARRDVLQVVPLHHHRNAAGYFDILDSAPEFRLRFGEGLAVFQGDESGDLVDVIFQEEFQLEQILNALSWGSAAPRRKSLGGGLHGRVHLGFCGKRSPRDALTSCGIRDVNKFRGGGFMPYPGKVILDFNGLRSDATAHECCSMPAEIVRQGLSYEGWRSERP